MNALITSSRQYGPFTSVTQGIDRWICDGIEYQFNIIGDAVVGEYVAPTPVVTQTVEQAPTKEQLMAELSALTAKIQSLE